MEDIEKEEYEEEIYEIKTRIDRLLEKMDFVKDICVHAKEDKWGNSNWVAKLTRAKGMLENIQEDIDDVAEEEEE